MNNGDRYRHNVYMTDYLSRAGGSVEMTAGSQKGALVLFFIAFVFIPLRILFPQYDSVLAFCPEN